ncbi:signal peptidase complex subunit SPC2 KNAG_0E03870 [Huiozyma naganishii CBS 8797]|uniref:Signal peptidase complex subunit 2 n=1 Tax=Huiozyma naganishii (strain ATCC MYA-139 / BCRC 22969 / CBS 8797 / KCTC 17520 / NBRC 10181 / NCYC 3082 / Yp74L-3) TaxID=1071383 RepID=J7S821_HUIN7|nr:hypothetical protein KNAG_0E03870 [Kazachstania naganishii CBS 8797]CCK70641.1 hypothetical protein KNAG_0E03870 [Kazachstania naganishii CBS 8797]
MSSPVNVYSISEVSQRLDEEIPVVFGRLGYKQSFKLIDLKLLIGYSIAIVAAASFLLDKKLGHNNVIGYQKLLVGCYAVLSLIFWYFKKFVEKSTIYTGTNSNDQSVINVRTLFKEAQPLYKVVLLGDDGARLEVDLQINKVFNEAGYLQTDLFFNWCKNQLTILKEKKDN